MMNRPTTGRHLPASFVILLSLLAMPGVFASQEDLQDELSKTQVSNLALTGKVWGYLKYHHPTITQGCIDWDFELLSMLPEILDAKNNAEAQRELAGWADVLDRPDDCTRIDSRDLHLEPRTGWLESETLLGPELTDLVQSASVQSRAGIQHYVSQQAGVGNPLFLKEQPYADVEIDWRHRLLALFRFWNIVEFWFPYRDLIDGDWDSVLANFIPQLYAAESKEDYVLVLAELVASVNDGHANVWAARNIKPPKGSSMPPFAIRMVEGKPYVWKRLDPVSDVPGPEGAPPVDGLHLGDVIVAINGRPVEEIFDEASPYYGASNESSKRRQIGQSLLLGDDEHVVVSVERNGELLDVSERRLPRDSLNVRQMYWHDRDGETLQLLSDEIAYLKLSSVDNKNAAEYVNAAAGTRGLVIDIRNYPSSFMVFALGQHLVSEKTEFARFTQGDLSAPGTFRFTDPIAIEPKTPFYEGRVVVLVDDSSVSQSEYTTMAFRSAPNTIVIGSQTAGADGNLSRIPFPGEHWAGMSGIGVFYPDKTPTQRVGIVPDIEARPTIDGLRTGRDEVLEVAIREILGADASEADIRSLTALPQ